MNYLISLLCVTMMLAAAQGASDHFSVKFDNKTGFELGDAHFPSQFSFKTIDHDMKEYPYNTTFKIDGKNNIFSFAVDKKSFSEIGFFTYFEIFDFGTGKAWNGLSWNGECYSLGDIDHLSTDVSKYLDYIWDTYARITDDRWEGGHHYQTVNVPYTPDYNETVYFTDNVITHLYGYRFGGGLENKTLTTSIHEEDFTREDHYLYGCSGHI